MTIATEGIYAFQLASDDGSWLFIDSGLVINHGGQHSPTDPPGAASLSLSQGVHQIEVDYYETCGGQSGIDLSWTAPGTPSSVIVPSTVLVPPPSLDGEGMTSGGCANSFDCQLLSTANSPDIIVLVASCQTNSPPTLCTSVTPSIADGSGLQFSQHSSYCYNGVYFSVCLWEYYAIATSPLNNDNVTAFPSNSQVRWRFVTFGVSGADTNKIFDGALPASNHCSAANGNPSDCTVSFVTSQTSAASPYEFLFSIASLNDAGFCYPPASQGWITTVGDGYREAEYQVASIIRHGFSFTCTANGDPLIIMSDGIQGRSPPSFGVGGDWNPLGPSPIGNCFGNTGSLCSGRITALALDPAHSGTVYLGGAQGGVWKSTNGGSAWIPLTDNQPSLAVGSLALDSNGTLYVGTGEGNGSGDSYYGAGILRSYDGGGTWSRLGAPTFGRSTINKIVVSPANSNILLIATGSGYTSASTSDQYVPPGVQTGIYLSTDGGNSWTLTSPQGIGRDVVQDPTNPSIVYAAVNVAGNGAVYKSTDGGSSWTALSGGLPTSGAGRIALAISRASPATVFAAIDVNGQGRVFRTLNGGANWSQMAAPAGFCGSQCWYDLILAVDPTDVNTIYLGGLDLYRTTDSGNSWVDLGGYAGFIHPDQHALVFNPSAHSTIYVGNDGGIWYSTAGNTCSPSVCWTNLNNGLGLTQFQSLASHPTDGNTYFGGTQDNGTPEHSGYSSVWNQLIGGDGGWTALDRNNPSTMYHTFEWVSPQRSDNGGASWQPITNGITTGDRSEFYIPMALSASAPSTLYLGTYRLYKTTNHGDLWFLPSPGLLTSDLISSIAVAPSNGSYVYVGTTFGTVFVSFDGGNRFSGANPGPPGRPITKIIVDQSNPARAFVTVTGFGGGHVFMTTNAGGSWSDISSNLPDLPANAVAQDSYGVVYVGTDVGVFVSTDSGSSWSALGNGLPRVAVVDLVFGATGVLLAATHGRGVWQLYLPDFVMTTSPDSVIVNAGAVGIATISVTGENGFVGMVNFVAILSSPSGLSCSLSSWTIMLGAADTSTLSCSGSPGTYSVTVTGLGFGRFHSVTVIFIVQDFAVTSSPATVTTNAGASASSVVNITSANGFVGTVNISLSTSGLSCAISPSSINLGAYGASTLTCVGSIPGNYVVIVTATSAGLSHSATILIVVQDFTISASLTETVNVGALANYTITLASVNGFSGIVKLTTSETPGSLACSLTQSSVDLSSSGYSNSNLLCRGSGGTYSITTSATSGSLVHSLSVLLTIRDFAVTISPGSITLSPGQSQNATVTLTTLQGFSGNVTVSSTSSPPGLPLNPGSKTINLMSGNIVSFNLTIPTTSSTPSGAYTENVTAAWGSVSHFVLLTVTVTSQSVGGTLIPLDNLGLFLPFLEVLVIFAGIVALTFVLNRLRNGKRGRYL